MKSVQFAYYAITGVILLYSILHIEGFPLYTPDGVHYAVFMFVIDIFLTFTIIPVYKYNKTLFLGMVLGLIAYNIGASQKPSISPIILIIIAVVSLYFFNKKMPSL